MSNFTRDGVPTGIEFRTPCIEGKDNYHSFAKAKDELNLLIL